MTQTSSGKTQGSLNIINVKNTLKACSIRVKRGVWDKHSKEEYDYRIMGANATNVEANATNMEANATNMEANTTIMGAKKEKKKQQKKDRYSEKMIIFAK